MIIGMTVGGSDPIASLEKVNSLDIATCQMSVPPQEWWDKDRLKKIREAMEENLRKARF